MDYASALGVSADELCSPRWFISCGLILALLLASFHGTALQYGASPAVLLIPAAGYLAMLLVLVVPIPPAVERRLRARRPLQRSLWRCLWQSTAHETPFIDVMVADGLTSLAKAFFDIGVGSCLLHRTGGGVAFFLNGVEISDVMPVGDLEEIRFQHGAPARSLLGSTLDACSRSPAPFALWALPYLIRARQCIITARNSADEYPRRVQYANFAKYMTALPVIFFAFCHAHASVGAAWVPFEAGDLEVLWASAAFINSVFSAFWDLVFDWGLLQPEWTGLRKTLLIKPIVPTYHATILVNLIGRSLWSWRWSASCASSGAFMCTYVQQVSEVLRRCLWNVFRVEWECVKRELYLPKSPPPSEKSEFD